MSQKFDLSPGAVNVVVDDVFGTMPGRQRLALMDAQLRNEAVLAELREREAKRGMKVVEHDPKD